MTSNTHKKYALTNDNKKQVAIYFKIENVVVKSGQSLGVVGSIPELGEWQKSLMPLIYTSKNIWETVDPMVISLDNFSYKYVIIENDQIKKWEGQTENRMVDFESTLL